MYALAFADSKPRHESQFYSVREMADILGKSQDTIRRAIKRGDLPAIKIGTYRVRRTDFEAWVARAAVQPNEPVTEAATFSPLMDYRW